MMVMMIGVSVGCNFGVIVEILFIRRGIRFDNSFLRG
jgi:hypothetical protein